MPSFVITGGPGSGKSTLLNALAQSGYRTVPEVSRELIRAEVTAGSRCLPWLNLPCFAKKCLTRMLGDFACTESEETVFFDRGIPDILAYLHTGGHSITVDLVEAASDNRYEKTVFVAPPWEEIYVNDDERWQTFAESCDLYRTIRKVYQEIGYDIVELPMIPLEQRVDFVINTIFKCV